jgi:Bacterial Ig-like domain (group 2)
MAFMGSRLAFALPLLAATACATSSRTTSPSGLTLGITGTTSVIAVGQTSQLGLSATMAGSTETVTTQATWQSSNAAIASVGATGLVTAQGYGATTITATFQGATATATFTVTIAGTWVSPSIDDKGDMFTWTLTQSASAVTGTIGFIPALSGFAVSTASIAGTLNSSTFTWTMTLTLSADPGHPQCVGIPTTINGTGLVQAGGTTMAVTVLTGTTPCDKNAPGGQLRPSANVGTMTKQ